MLFEERQLKVRLLEKKDNYLLAKWLSDPDVLSYYEGRDRPFDIEKVNRKFFNENQELTSCIVEFAGKGIGYIQFYEIEEDDRKKYCYDHVEIIYGMDQFIGETELWNKGIGTLLVSSMVRYLFTIKKAYRIIMDPQTWNKRAIRCYEKCGFQKVKKLPKHEYHEGEYRDCWLIEIRNNINVDNGQKLISNRL